jgi:hypothetical protein
MKIEMQLCLLAAALLVCSGTAYAQDSIIQCPVSSIQTDVTSSLPNDWWSTAQGGKLSGAEVGSIGGSAKLVCIYKMPNTEVSVMRDAPSGMRCSAERTTFRCRAGHEQGGAGSGGAKTYDVSGKAVADVTVAEQKGKVLTPGNTKDTSGPKVRTGGTCQDLALTGVEVRMLSRDPQGQYFFRLSAAIENHGGVDYRGARGQQQVDIYQISSGGSSRRLGQFDFDSVSAGSDRIEATYDVLRWRTSQEFPPSYRFNIVFGPDISSDGNAANDDCSRSNNSTTITGDEINSIIRGSGI